MTQHKLDGFGASGGTNTFIWYEIHDGDSISMIVNIARRMCLRLFPMYNQSKVDYLYWWCLTRGSGNQLLNIESSIYNILFDMMAESSTRWWNCQGRKWWNPIRFGSMFYPPQSSMEDNVPATEVTLHVTDDLSIGRLINSERWPSRNWNNVRRFISNYRQHCCQER